MTTLSSTQSERILAVLEETLDKLKFLGALTPDVLSHREELSQYVGDHNASLSHHLTVSSARRSPVSVTTLSVN